MRILYLCLDEFRDYLREDNIELDTGEVEWKQVSHQCRSEGGGAPLDGLGLRDCTLYPNLNFDQNYNKILV